MIEPVEPELKDTCLLSIVDRMGGKLTVHRTGRAAGLVMSKEFRGSAITLTREDRAALICQLIELQEDESIE